RGAGPLALRARKRTGSLRSPAAPAPRERMRLASLTARRHALRARRQGQGTRVALRPGVGLRPTGGLRCAPATHHPTA
ncbi:hypothetical protein ACQEVX_35880, partial [Streptomyces syringium]|uniref:hypothetical protein n=1 Tax=Streptomyces syringium TaxID=76729 RepID=UPI003D8BA459